MECNASTRDGVPGKRLILSSTGKELLKKPAITVKIVQWQGAALQSKGKGSASLTIYRESVTNHDGQRPDDLLQGANRNVLLGQLKRSD